MSNESVLQHKATLLRKLSLIATTEATSGHPSSCLSAADLLAVLFEKYYTFDTSCPENVLNDRLIFSKGHASPLLYACYAVSGDIPFSEVKTLRKYHSRLEGHPTPSFPFTEAATGSLGQGISVGAGMGWGMKKIVEEMPHRKFPLPHVYVLTGDGELAEGQIWEALNFASYYKLDNLIIMADINRLAQSDPTMFEHNVEEYHKRFESFGAHIITIDGHSLTEIDEALSLCRKQKDGKPHVIVAKTIKGKGVSLMENKEKWHGKALSEQELTSALDELGVVSDELRFELRKPTHKILLDSYYPQSSFVSSLSQTEEKATREVYGEVLAEAITQDKRIIVLDADTKNSTFSEKAFASTPPQSIECFIAEQNMASVAVGLSKLGFYPFASTFSAFLMRAADQIRMAVVSESRISFCGSHSGVSIGEDGPSQMGLEDLAFFGALPGVLILQPSDPISAQALFSHILSCQGISYLRTLRPKTSVLYDKSEQFPIGGSKLLASSEKDEVTIVASGITVGEALKAQKTLEQEGILVRVLDCYSLKPIDQQTLLNCLSETKYPALITVEDHFEHGGLGDFVLSAVSHTESFVSKLAVTHISTSGTKEELLKDAHIDHSAIVHAVKNVISTFSKKEKK